MSFSDKLRTAAGPPPFPPPKGGAPPSFAPSKRTIPKDHPFDPRSLKPMAKMLWAMSISLGHALTAYRQFNRVKSVTISPDGLLGGHGYVMAVTDVRKKLYEACEALSTISDTLHDEINAPHWKPRLSELDPNTAEDVERFIDESTRMLESPEEESEEEMDRIEKSNDDKWEARGVPTPKDDEPASEIPTDGPGGQGQDQAFHGGWGGQQKEARLRGQPQHVIMLDDLAGFGKHGLLDVLTLVKLANSSEPVEFLPGGPRVNHIGPGEADGPLGTFGPGDGEAHRQDMPSEEPLGWRDSPVAQSALPSDPETPTDADDFGLGYGRSGDASKGYGTTAPDGKGFWGPSSGLPDDPGGKTRDPEGDITTPLAEQQSGGSGSNVWGASAMLPNDDQPPVARTDYYPGSKGNIVSESEMPGDESVTYNYDRDMPNTGQVFERTDNPYIKWDDSTKNYRPDTTYERRPREE